MSYSFQVRAATLAAALAAAAEKFDVVVKQFPIHAKDKEQAMANAKAVGELLKVDDTRDVVVSMNGYISSVGEDIGSLNISASAYSTPREAS